MFYCLKLFGFGSPRRWCNMFNYSTLIAVACQGIKKGLYMSSCFLPTFTAYFTLKVRYFSFFFTAGRACNLSFFKKIQDWTLKSERIWKWILRFFARQINPSSLRSWSVKGTEESTSRVDSSVSLTHHDPKDLGLICLVQKRNIHFRSLLDLRIQSSISLKKRTLSFALNRRSK